ncbi:MAG: hypothetical protein GY774_00405 [Planctomycetes bacterium]|nr:hypothetical protein [Planctomycetota bacterium]
MNADPQINQANFDKVLAAYEKFQEEGVVAREQVCLLTSDLFPSFTDCGTNDELLSDYCLEQFSYYRALGMSVIDTAYAIKMSASRLNRFLNGEKLSLERFVELIQQELFARAECKSTLLKDIKEATGSKQWRTSLTLLEKLYPEEFGNKGGLEDKIDKLAEKAWTINIVDADVKAEPTTEEV